MRQMQRSRQSDPWALRYHRCGKYDVKRESIRYVIKPKTMTRDHDPIWLIPHPFVVV